MEEYLKQLEYATAILAVVTSPLWFINLFGVNLGIDDIFFAVAALLIVVRKRSYIIAPTPTSGIAIGTFLLAGAISIGVSPFPYSAWLNFMQYILIFVVVIPVGIDVFRNPHARWVVFLLLIFIIDIITLLTVWERIFLVDQMSQVGLWYANRNQLFWLISSGAVLNLALICEKSNSKSIKGIATTFLLIQVTLGIGGLTLSAWLLLGGAGYIMAAYLLYSKENLRNYRPIFHTFVGVLTLAGIGFIYYFWDFLYIFGNIYYRLAQYDAALRAAIQTFPLGTGLESSELVLATRVPDGVTTSVHNVFLAYFLELGLLGVLGFSLLLFDWTRRVLIPLSHSSYGIRPYEAAFAAIFCGYIFVMLFQPVPVTRFWWVIFSLSWASIYTPTKMSR